jgi:biopolymer transport protein ExbD
VQFRRGAAIGSLSLTPLIDVVFLLLIFFLVATRFAQEDRELDVKLPTASEARPLTETPRDVFVNIDDQGRYFVDGKILTVEELEEVLLQAAANNPANQAVVIRADRRVTFQYVVNAMNACNKANIFDYKVTTQETES